MLFLTLFLFAGADEPNETLAKKMLPVYTKEATDYALAAEVGPMARKDLELKKEPVFEWSNPTREGVQQGVVFVWLREGRPACLASIFSQVQQKPVGRQIIHEFHALDENKLIVTRPKDSLNAWKPKAGLARKELTDAPAPAAAPGARLIQMKKLAQEFSGHETDDENRRWDLRLLPAPLYRYPSAKTGVIDGALFTLVSSAGTDPEVLLLLEAKEKDGKTHWEYALGRFSDRNLYVQRNEKDVWSMVRNDSNNFNNDPQHLYSLYADKVVSMDGELLARVRVSEEVRWGEVVPLPGKK